MNIYTKMIMERFGLNKTIALKIQKKMECSSLDFSECSDEEFNQYADKAYFDIIGKFLN
jgi:hypothetical protein